jgi:hypothetical protein
MLEVFTKEGTNSEAAKNHIFEKTGMMHVLLDIELNYQRGDTSSLNLLI